VDTIIYIFHCGEQSANICVARSSKKSSIDFSEYTSASGPMASHLAGTQLAWLEQHLLTDSNSPQTDRKIEPGHPRLVFHLEKTGARQIGWFKYDPS